MDLGATYRSEPILPPIPPECARRVVVVTVLRGPHRNLAGYAITGLFEMDEAALVECALTWCQVLKGLPTFGAPHRRAAHDPNQTGVCVRPRYKGRPNWPWPHHIGAAAMDVSPGTSSGSD
jgi:hypothetical protein